MRLLRLAAAGLVFLSSCSVEDSLTARRAETALIGMKEVDLQSCLGAPDQHSSFGATEILSYYSTSTSSSNFSLPIIGGLGFSNGGYCHVVVRVDDGVVSRIRYVGETNAVAAPDAYCAPIVRGCVAMPKS